MNVEVIHEECSEYLGTLDENSIDACVTDPPYELGFMGEEWDRSGIAFDPEFWAKVKRVLKPGAHMAVFGGSRTYHRIAVGIEDAGFEIRDTIDWIYGCVSPDTDILTSEGWKSHDEISIGDTAVCYDKDTGTYQHGPVQQKVEKYNQPRAYRIQGNCTDQIVSPMHRVLVERGGNLHFERAWKLARQQEISVPVLEDLRRVREDISGDEQRTNRQQDLQPSLSQQNRWRSKFRQNLAGRNQLSDQFGVQPLRRKFFQTRGQIGRKERQFLLNGLLQQMEIRKQNSSRAYEGNCTNERTVRRSSRKNERANDRKIESKLEGGRNVREKTGKLRRSSAREVSGRVQRNGKKEWVCARTQAQSGKRNRAAAQKRRSGTSHRPRPPKQRHRKFDAFSEQPRTQAVRTQRQPRTDLATIEPIENYNDMVWCVKVPTGAFVARRNGQMFVTGNSGFAKSHDIGKAIDSHFDKKDEREPVGFKNNAAKKDGSMIERESYDGWRDNPSQWQERGRDPYERAPATEEAEKWNGWDTQLKPAKEPIIIARKPLEGTVAENVLKYGTGGMNIDGCRIETGDETFNTPQSNPNNREGEVSQGFGITDSSVEDFQESQKKSIERLQEKGRWPANVIFDRAMAKKLDEQSGMLKAGGNINPEEREEDTTVYGSFNENVEHSSYGDKGGASMYFKTIDYHVEDNLGFFYCPKAKRSERDLGVEENDHVTVKPIELMSYLVRLLSPEGGEIIDPFAGSGTTGMSAVLEGVSAHLVELEKSHVEIAEQRVRYAKTNYQSLREDIYGDPSNNITDEETEVNDHNFW
mgnify:FL=1